MQRVAKSEHPLVALSGAESERAQGATEENAVWIGSKHWEDVPLFEVAT